MKHVRRRAIFYCCFLQFVLGVFLVLLSACGNGGSSSGGGIAGSSGTGSLVFDVELQSSRNTSEGFYPAPTSVNCKETGIKIIEATVVDQDETPIARGGPWDCELHYGTIEGVSAGDNRTVVLDAKDYPGNTIAQGRSDPVTVIAGQTTDAGTINLVLINRPPVLDPIGPKIINEGQLLEFTVTATDPDPGDVLTYTAEKLPEGAEFDPAIQRFSWTPDYGDVGNYRVLFRVTDDGTPPLSDSEEVPITVNEVPHYAPILDPIIVPPVNEREYMDFYVTATDLDPGDVLTYSTSPLPTGAGFDPIKQLFSWTPDCGYAGDYLVTFTVTDSYGLTDSEEVTITVGPEGGVNNPPSITGPSDVTLTFNPGDEVSYDFSVNDPDECDADRLVVYVFDYWGELPPGDEPELNPLGDSTWQCVWTPPENKSYRFQIVVEDDSEARTWVNMRLQPVS